MIVLLIFLLYRIPVIQVHLDEETFYLKEDRFELSWIHSVENEKWFEVYEKDGEDLFLSETYFKTYGAGVPADGEVIHSDDGYVHMKMNRSIPELNISVSNNVKTKIHTEEKTIDLYKLAQEYESVSISIEQLHLWEYIGGTFK
ncbi:DUF1850 domain-containing protein [Halalkalibacillus sediminis]|uniref:DUF1850 domain-containing protein n=1 Tax=Halalkalibacillus sediminis TaxID=2018042 RepID=A0A2I0QV33_9BACI|nr:DUF1850 domain-containing protein [Halalkalibacillus sediminis]